ncbi:hypothetical protein MHOCP_03040 [Moorella humiferrea]|uniref:tripartite tricarboxylate transporter substrate binding protein n=1 Tax=Neomoorella humiferrea TaxID=676965 RepID=UPI0030D13ABC
MKKVGIKKLLAIATSLLLVSILLGGCSSSGTPASGGEKKIEYPTKPIEITVGFAAGGTADISTRMAAEGAKKYLPNGQSFVVSNKTGASGTIQLAEIFQSKPDGYKLGSVTTGNLIMQPNFGKTPYKATDFEPIAMLSTMPNLLVVRSDAPYNTFEEWLEYVKANPDKFTYGTAGTGDTKHVAMAALSFEYDIKVKQVAFDGSAQTLTALLGGHIMGAIAGPNEIKSYVDSGQVKVLANLGSTKTDEFGDIAFIKELKPSYPGFDTWTAIVAPKGTPKEIIDILAEAFEKALQDPEVIANFQKTGTQPAYAGPEELRKIIETSAKVSKEVMLKAGIIKE